MPYPLPGPCFAALPKLSGGHPRPLFGLPLSGRVSGDGVAALSALRASPQALAWLNLLANLLCPRTEIQPAHRHQVRQNFGSGTNRLTSDVWHPQ